MNDDEHWMQLALAQARLAGERGEVPVGAVLVREGELVAAAGNGQIAEHDPCAHAEIRCLREAASKLQNYRLAGCEMFVTLEPCVMCSGAMVHARIDRLVYATAEPKAGAVESKMRYLAAPWINHRIEVSSGVLERDCSQLLQDFFRRRRAQDAG